MDAAALTSETGFARALSRWSSSASAGSADRQSQKKPLQRPSRAEVCARSRRYRAEGT
jgi:hypothetical protein